MKSTVKALKLLVIPLGRTSRRKPQGTPKGHGANPPQKDRPQQPPTIFLPQSKGRADRPLAQEKRKNTHHSSEIEKPRKSEGMKIIQKRLARGSRRSKKERRKKPQKKRIETFHQGLILSK